MCHGTSHVPHWQSRQTSVFSVCIHSSSKTLNSWIFLWIKNRQNCTNFISIRSCVATVASIGHKGPLWMGTTLKQKQSFNSMVASNTFQTIGKKLCSAKTVPSKLFTEWLCAAQETSKKQATKLLMLCNVKLKKKAKFLSKLTQELTPRQQPKEGADDHAHIRKLALAHLSEHGGHSWAWTYAHPRKGLTELIHKSMGELERWSGNINFGKRCWKSSCACSCCHEVLVGARC